MWQSWHIEHKTLLVPYPKSCMMSSPFLPRRVCYSLRNPSKLPQGGPFLYASLGSMVWMDRAKVTKDIHRGLCTESSYTGWQGKAHMRIKPLFRHSAVGLSYWALNWFCALCTEVPRAKGTAPGNSFSPVPFGFIKEKWTLFYKCKRTRGTSIW